MRLLTSCLVLWCLVPPAGARAQEAPSAGVTPLRWAERLEVRSRTLGETRPVDVVLPPAYAGGEERYPVLVVLDGESLARPAAGIAHFLAALREVPEMIVVGVHNTRRMRDLTPAPRAGWRPPVPTNAGFGGADDFLAFLESELLPVIDARYRTHPYRVLVGHSLGGLFVAHALSAGTDAFDAYLALDPALWWNDRGLIDPVIAALAGAGGTARFSSAQARGGFTGADWARLSETVPGHVGERHELEGESHGSMPIVGMRLGLRSLFADFPAGDTPLGAEPVAHLVRHAEGLQERLGFPVAPRPGQLAGAIRAAVDARMLEDAERGIARLDALEPEHPSLPDLRTALARAAAEGDDGFVPLVFDEVRPDGESAAPFLGRWEGVRDHERGVDFTWIVTVDADGDSLLVHGEQIGPDGGSMAGPLTVVGLSDDGALEFGMPLRGVPGMEVYIAREESPGVLVGYAEIRGFRVPEGAGGGRTTFRLERRPAGR